MKQVILTEEQISDLSNLLNGHIDAITDLLNDTDSASAWPSDTRKNRKIKERYLDINLALGRATNSFKYPPPL